jgi:two-component sensor histidine kinase
VRIAPEPKRLIKAKEAVQNNLAVVKSIAREHKKKLKTGEVDEAPKEVLTELQTDVLALAERRGALNQVILKKPTAESVR